MNEFSVTTLRTKINLFLMENSILMSNLTELVKKIIISFCKTNVQFQTRLEILGSIHVRSDNKDVVAFVLNEHCNSIGEDVANDNLFGKNANMPVNEEIKTNIKKEAQDSVEIYSDENEYDNTFTETRVKHENNFIQQPPIEEDAEAYEENDANNYYENEDEYNSYDYSSPHYSNIPKAKPKRRKPTIKNTSANNQFSDNSFYQVLVLTFVPAL